MRILLSCLVALFFLATAKADTTQTRTFTFDGTNVEQILSTLTEKTRTEYRTVTVPRTCYRTDYRRQCRTYPGSCRQACAPQRGCRTICSPERRVCNSVPVRVPYRCMRTETRSYEVFDYNVQSNINLNFNIDQEISQVQENFRVRVTGETVKLNVVGSKNYAIVLEDESKSESWNGNTKNLDVSYKLKLIPSERINGVLGNGIQNVKLRNGTLSFSLGKGFNFDDFSQRIRIFRNRRVLRDILVLDRQIGVNDVLITTSNNSSSISIDLSSLGVSIPAQKRIILDTSYNIGDQVILNKNDLKTTATANWIFR